MGSSQSLFDQRLRFHLKGCACLKPSERCMFWQCWYDLLFMLHAVPHLNYLVATLNRDEMFVHHPMLEDATVNDMPIHLYLARISSMRH